MLLTTTPEVGDGGKYARKHAGATLTSLLMSGVQHICSRILVCKDKILMSAEA